MENKIKGISLYHFQACPYCALTSDAIDQMGLEIEKRDILQNPQHRTDLVLGGGKATVPSLRLDTEDGQSSWLYESTDIIRFLESNVGHQDLVARD